MLRESCSSILAHCIIYYIISRLYLTLEPALGSVVAVGETSVKSSDDIWQLTVPYSGRGEWGKADHWGKANHPFCWPDEGCFPKTKIAINSGLY